MEPGWVKVIAATVVAVLGLGGFNLAVWRRLNAARAAREQSEARAAVPDAERAAPPRSGGDRHRGDS
jgi:hypothetical protein